MTAFKRIVICILCICFISQQAGFAQVSMVELSSRPAAVSPVPGSMLLHLRACEYDLASGGLRLEADKPSGPAADKTSQSPELRQYFLTGLVLPDSTFWVNLRPDSPDKMLDPVLAKTDLGRVMLAADLQLKKDIAAYTSPATPTGKEYWSKLYKKAEELYGSSAVTIPALTRPWIVPGEILLRESRGNVYIYKARLEVKLESDYLKGSGEYAFSDSRQAELNRYASGIIRETIIPKLATEVNASQKYAELRQVFFSLILAQWFKKRFAGSAGEYSGMIDSGDVSAIASREAWSPQEYFQAYQKSFREGEYNVKETIPTAAGQSIRSYTSGGIEIACPIPSAPTQAGERVMSSSGVATSIGAAIGKSPTQNPVVEMIRPEQQAPAREEGIDRFRQVTESVTRAAVEVTGDPGFEHYRLAVGEYSVFRLEDGKPSVTIGKEDTAVDGELAGTLGHEYAHGWFTDHTDRLVGFAPGMALMWSNLALFFPAYFFFGLSPDLFPYVYVPYAALSSFYLGLFPKRILEAKCDLVGALIARKAGYGTEERTKAMDSQAARDEGYLYSLTSFLPGRNTHPEDSVRARNVRALDEFLAKHPGIDLRKLAQAIKEMGWLNTAFFSTRGVSELSNLFEAQPDGGAAGEQFGFKKESVRDRAKFIWYERQFDVKNPNGIRINAVRKLAEVGSFRAAQRILDDFPTRSGAIREAELEALRKIGAPAVELMCSIIKEGKTSYVCYEIGRAVAVIDKAKALETLIPVAKDANADFIRRDGAIRTLAEFWADEPRVVKALVEIITSGREKAEYDVFAHSASKGLAEIGETAAVAVIAEVLNRDNPKVVREKMFWTLWAMSWDEEKSEARPAPFLKNPFLEFLRSPDPFVRAKACYYVPRIGGLEPDALGFLTVLLDDPDADVRQQAEEAVWSALFSEAKGSLKENYTNPGRGLAAIRRLPGLAKILQAAGADSASITPAIIALSKLFIDEEAIERLTGKLVSWREKGLGPAQLIATLGLTMYGGPFSEKEFGQYEPALLQMGRDAGDIVGPLFQEGIPRIKTLIGNEQDLKLLGYDLIRLGRAAGAQIKPVYESITMLTKFFDREKLKSHWPELIEAGIAAEGNAQYLFECGFLLTQGALNSKEDARKMGRDFKDVFALCEGVEMQTEQTLLQLKDFFRDFPNAWKKLIKPVIYGQTQAAFLCLEQVELLYRDGAFESDADLEFLNELIQSQGIRAYDFLTSFLFPGIDRFGLMARPLSREKEMLSRYIKESPYNILEIYEAYKNNPGKLTELHARAKNIHEKILSGDASGVENDPLFSRMLYYVFPPAVTTDNSRYLNIYQHRPDRQDDTKAIPASLRDGYPVEVSTGRYILKDAARPLDETPWNTILGAVSEVNQEAIVALKPEEVSGLGGQLMKDWQAGNLVKHRGDLLKGLYRYFRHSRNSTLPSRLDSIVNIMALKEFVGDTLRDLVTECAGQYQKSDPGEYGRIMDGKFPGRITDPWKVAPAVKAILDHFRDEPDKAKAKISALLDIQDEAASQLWEQVKDKSAAKDIEEILKGLTLERQAGKEASEIVSILQGKEYKKMQGEVSAKYRFNEAQGKMKLKFIVSKRKAHGVVGLNMGVCVAPDVQLWKNPDFMNAIIFDENGIAQGGMHLLVIGDNGKRYLALPGINPSDSLLAKVNSDDIYNKLIDYVRELAKPLGCQGVLIPTNSTIHSNRSEIQRVIAARNYRKTTLGAVHPFSYAPYEYSFQECFEVGARSSDGGEKLEPSLRAQSKTGRIHEVSLWEESGFAAAAKELKAGSALRLDFSGVVDPGQDDYNRVGDATTRLCNAIKQEFTAGNNRPEQFGELGFALAELVNNAFTWGNKMNFDAPVFITVGFDQQGVAERFNVYDLAVWKTLSEKEIGMAKLAGIGGNRAGLDLVNKQWDYERRLLPELGATRASIARVPLLTGKALDEAIARALKANAALPAAYLAYKQLADTGVFVFRQYDGYLSREGVQAKKFFDELALDLRRAEPVWLYDFPQFKQYIALIPRVTGDFADLHLELFKEAFEGVSAEQLKAFKEVGTRSLLSMADQKKIIHLKLTPVCSNQCSICGMKGTERDLAAGPMPFPVAVKIMRKLADDRLYLTPYRDSDLLDYYDSATGATITDIVGAAQKLGFADLSLLTHGTNSRAASAEETMRALSRITSLSMSLHVYHPAVVALAKKLQGPQGKSETLLEKRAEIVTFYSDRFTGLLKATYSPDTTHEPVKVRLFDVQTPIKYLENVEGLSPEEEAPAQHVLAVLKELQSIQDEVVARVKQDAPIAYPIAQSKPNEVAWLGGAAQLLARLGLPHRLIADIQAKENQQKNLSSSAFDAVIEPDGSLAIEGSTDRVVSVRTVREVFDNPGSEEFRVFLELLRGVLEMRDSPGMQFIGLEVKDRAFVGRVWDDLAKYLTGKGIDCSRMTPQDFQVRHRYIQAFDSLLVLAFPRARQILASLPEGAAIDDATAKELFGLLQSMPCFPEGEFYITFDHPEKFGSLLYKTEEGRLDDYTFTYSFAGKKALEQNIYQPYARFTLPHLRAYPKKDDGGAPGTTRVPAQLQSSAGDTAPGGIDFRGLPMKIAGVDVQTMFKDLPQSAREMDVDAEWASVQNMVNHGLLPSCQRLKECVGACYLKGDLPRRSENLLRLIAGVLKLEEERNRPTDPAVTDILAVLEAA